MLAALSQCHLLSYLHACVTPRCRGDGLFRSGLSRHGAGRKRGGGAFREAMLRPRVVVAEASMTEAANEAHEQAHEWCSIANSVNFPIRIEPVTEVHG